MDTTEKIKHALKSIFRGFALALIVAFIVRNFLFEWYLCDSGATNNDLHKGDLVFVEKISYGARFPLTPFALPFAENYIPFTKIPTYTDVVTLPYFRIPATTLIACNELIVFNLPTETNKPIDRRKPYVRRCVALPGDTISISGIHLKRNSMVVNFDTIIQFSYVCMQKLSDSLKTYSSQLGITFRQHPVLDLYEFETFPYKVHIFKELLGADSSKIRPKTNHKSYFCKNFIVPKKGFTIESTPENISRYGHLIETHENGLIETTDTSHLINGVAHYTFRLNYYLVISDTWDKYEDSRHWGALPESHIIGKIMGVCKSVTGERDDL